MLENFIMKIPWGGPVDMDFILDCAAEKERVRVRNKKGYRRLLWRVTRGPEEATRGSLAATSHHCPGKAEYVSSTHIMLQGAAVVCIAHYGSFA